LAVLAPANHDALAGLKIKGGSTCLFRAIFAILADIGERAGQWRV